MTPTPDAGHPSLLALQPIWFNHIHDFGELVCSCVLLLSVANMKRKTAGVAASSKHEKRPAKKGHTKAKACMLDAVAKMEAQVDAKSNKSGKAKKVNDDQKNSDIGQCLSRLTDKMDEPESEEGEEPESEEQHLSEPESEEAATQITLNGDLTDSTKAGIELLVNNPEFAGLFKLNKKAVKKLKLSSQRDAISNAFSPVISTASDDSAPATKHGSAKERSFWFERFSPDLKGFVGCTRAYRKKIQVMALLYVFKEKKDDTEVICANMIFDQLPKGFHEFPEESRQKFLAWAHSGVRRPAVLAACVHLCLQVLDYVRKARNAVRDDAREQLVRVEGVECPLEEAPEKLEEKLGKDFTPPKAAPHRCI